MKNQKTIILLTILFCAIFSVIPFVNATTTTFYQSNNLPNTAGYAANGVGKGWAHSFVSTATGTADTVSLWVDRDGTPTGELTVDIYTANTTHLISKVGYGGTLSLAAITSKAIYYVPVSASLTNGQMYAIVCNVTVWSGNWGVRGWGETGGGNYYWLNSGAGWTLQSSWGEAFAVLGAEPPGPPATYASMINVDTNLGKTLVFGISPQTTLFALDSKVISARNGVVLNTLDLPTAQTHMATLGAVSTNMIAINDSYALITSVWAYSAGGNYSTYLSAYMLNVNSFAYTELTDALIDSAVSTTLIQSSAILTERSGHYYAVFGSMAINNYAYIVEVYPNLHGALTYTTDTVIRGSAIYVNSETDVNVTYVITRNNFNGARYNIDKINFANMGISYLGTSSSDYDYGTTYTNGTTTYGGFVYYIGYDYLSSYNLYQVNLAYTPYRDQFSIATIKFTDAAVSNENIENLGINTGSVMARPFTVMVPTGSGGNASGTYSLATWSNAIRPGGLTGFQFTLSNFEIASPTWTIGSILYDWTPQQPQTFYNLTSSDYGGFQAPDSQTGIMINYETGEYSLTSTFSLNPSFNYVATIQGGAIYVAPAQILVTSPSELSLSQSTTYTYSGYTYIDSIVQGNGTFKIEITALSTSSTISALGTYTEALNDTITDGFFDVTISGRSGPSAVLYQGFRVTLDMPDNSISYTVTYLFAFYAGYPGSTTTPNPSNLPDIIDFSTNQLTTLFLPLFIFGILVIVGFLFAGFAGGLIGWNAAGVITVITGMFAPWVIVVVVLTDVVVLFVRPQIETVSSRISGKLKGEG